VNVLLDGDVTEDVDAVDLDMRVGRGREPAVVEVHAGRLAGTAHLT
jgi:hypothetical protein